jgi:hypothetical protein
MTRFFFDVKSGSTIEHDYKGGWFPSVEQASQMADLVAMDLGCTRSAGPFDTEVQVRDAAGTLFCSVPVVSVDALAA